MITSGPAKTPKPCLRRLGSSSLRDMAWVNVRSLTDAKVLQVALETAAAVLARPTFPDDAIARVRQQMQIGLRSSLQSPATVAKRRFFRTLYGDHPYAHSPDGEQETLARITREDLQRFHGRYYVAANAVVAIVGAVDRAQAEAFLASAVFAETKRLPKDANHPLFKLFPDFVEQLKTIAG